MFGERTKTYVRYGAICGQEDVYLRMSGDDYQNEVRSLLESNYPGLSRLLARKVGDPELAADMLNQAVIHSLQQLSQNVLADPYRIAGYVYRTALNMLRNHRRNYDNRLDRQASADQLEFIASEVKRPDEHLESAMASQIRRVVSELPTERDRILLKRFYLDEDDKAQICCDMNLNPLHFDKVIFRARQRMRELLEERGFKKTDFLVVLLACFASVP